MDRPSTSLYVSNLCQSIGSGHQEDATDTFLSITVSLRSFRDGHFDSDAILGSNLLAVSEDVNLQLASSHSDACECVAKCLWVDRADPSFSK